MPTLSDSMRASTRDALARFMHHYRTVGETQHNLLASILRRNADTAFGQEHGFGQIRTIRDYQQQVPIREWRDFSPYVDAVIDGRRDTLTKEPPFFYHRTTGTTGQPKMIPFTRRCLEASKLTHRMWGYKMLLDNPALLKGKVMAILNAGIDGYTSRREAYGAVSGNIYFRLPSIIRRAYCHPYDIYHIENIEARRYTLLRFAAEQSCTLACTGNPSSLLALFEFGDRHSETLIQDIHDGTLAGKFEVPDPIRMLALNSFSPNPRRARMLAEARSRVGRLQPADYWPELQVVACWISGSMGHFAPLLREWCGENFRFRDPGYMASEGVFSIPIQNDSSDGILAIHSIFFEFVPEQEFGRTGAPALLAHELEPGRNYHVVVTTTGGLYRYAMRDVIRVTDMQAGSPSIRFLYKDGHVQNMQGEMMTVDHVMNTMSAVTTELGVKFQHFQIMAELSNRRYVLHIEPTGELPPRVLDRVLSNFERELKKNNENYAQFRADELIAAPGLRIMSKGWFDHISRDHIARSGRDSQFKPSVLVGSVEHPEMVETAIELN